MRTTAFITFVVASLLLLSSTDAASLREKRGSILHGVPGGAHNAEFDVALGLRSGKRALRERGALLRERGALLRERGALLTGRGALLTERGSLLTERDVLFKERDMSLTDNSGQAFSLAPVKRDNNGEKNGRNSKRSASDTNVVVV